MRNIKLVIEYEGTNYCGWQAQKNGPSIQESIQDAIEKITGSRLSFMAQAGPMQECMP
jgi:tRNA pseudouridine38-40 synthase